MFLIDCSALHRASNFNFFRVRFCVDGRGAAAGLGLVEDGHDFETESTTRKMQVGKKGKELKGRNCDKVPSPARCQKKTKTFFLNAEACILSEILSDYGITRARGT